MWELVKPILVLPLLVLSPVECHLRQGWFLNANTVWPTSTQIFVQPVRKYWLSDLYAKTVFKTCTHIFFVQLVREYCLSDLYAKSVFSNVYALIVCPTCMLILFTQPVRKYWLSNLYENTDWPTCTQQLFVQHLPKYLSNLYANNVRPTCTQTFSFPSL